MNGGGSGASGGGSALEGRALGSLPTSSLSAGRAPGALGLRVQLAASASSATADASRRHRASLPVGCTRLIAVMSGLRIVVITVSDTRNHETDTSGQLAVERLAEAGHTIAAKEIVRDDASAIREAVSSAARDAAADVVVLTGGTGITARDVTPEALAPLVTKPIPGFGELFRMLSYAEIGAAAIQSRAFAALCGTALVFALPGSTAAVRLALEKLLLPQFDVKTKPCNFAELLPRIRGAR